MLRQDGPERVYFGAIGTKEEGQPFLVTGVYTTKPSYVLATVIEISESPGAEVSLPIAGLIPFDKVE